MSTPTQAELNHAIREALKGAKLMSLHVYRSADGCDCTLGGVSSKVMTIYIVQDDGPCSLASVAITAQREQYQGDFLDLVFTAEQRGPNYWALRPINHNGRALAFGGNLASGSDSRIKHVYRIHDRDMARERR